MKILVTGGAGYKGIILTEKLLRRGHDVTILDNFMYGYSSVLHLVNEPKLDFDKIDVRNLTEKNVKEFDVIFHLAGISGMPACAANPHSAEVINVDATRKLVKLTSKNQLIINASTTSFYGASGSECDETVAVSPVSLYGKTKYEAEKIVQEKENSISLRFATIFGTSSKMRDDLLLNDFVYKAIVERAIVIFAGHSKRTFVHVLDAINAYMFCLDNIDKMKGQVYNVGDESLNFSKIDIANAIKKIVDFEIIDSSLPDLDKRSFLVSFKKIRSLGYRSELSLEYGISELIKLYKFYRVYSPYNII